MHSFLSMPRTKGYETELKYQDRKLSTKLGIELMTSA